MVQETVITVKSYGHPNGPEWCLWSKVIIVSESSSSLCLPATMLLTGTSFAHFPNEAWENS